MFSVHIKRITHAKGAYGRISPRVKYTLAVFEGIIKESKKAHQHK